MLNKFCLECNNSVFNEKLYLQEDSTAIVPHMSCSYSGIAMYRFDLKASSFTPCVGKGLEMLSLQCGITLCKNFISSLNLYLALIHLVRSNLLCL